MPLSRQQRRKAHRDLLDRGRKALARGLPRPFGEDDAVAIALAIRERVGSGGPTKAASDAAEAAETLLERTIAADTRELPLACGKGCAHCCRLTVTCTAPEILRVVRQLRQQSDGPGRIAFVEREASRRRSMSPADLAREKPPCPLLVDGACSIYAVRPLPCRSLLSLSASACQLAVEQQQGQVPLVTGALDTAEVVRAMLIAAAAPLGRSDAGYDLTAGLAAALSLADPEADWIAGREVFDGVRCEQRSPELRALQDRLVQRMAALEG